MIGEVGAVISGVAGLETTGKITAGFSVTFGVFNATISASFSTMVFCMTDTCFSNSTTFCLVASDSIGALFAVITAAFCVCLTV